MKSRKSFLRRLFTPVCVLIALASGLEPSCLRAQEAQPRFSDLLPVGVARRDITPDYPIRLSGYGGRREPNKGIAQRLHAKALAFGDDSGAGPAVLLTVDNCGIPSWLRSELLRRLASKIRLQDPRFAVCSSHTHCAPMVAGTLPNLFSADIPAEHQAVIEHYTSELTDALEQVVLNALANRKPSRIAWGIGSVNFAANRRKFSNRPVDHSLPILRITDDKGNVTALLSSYACHCTTLGIDQIHGDWAGCAQETLEREFPGAIALTAIGCGADQNPSPRSTLELAAQHGGALAEETARLARSTLIPLSHLPEAKSESINLSFAPLPSRDEWLLLAGSSSSSIAYHARKNLARLDRGEMIPTSLPYLVQTWTFGDDLAMVFLPGEVVVDYSLRLKTEFDHRRLWVNSYSNDVPAYIPSKRILEEGGYEGGGAMVYYDRPTKFTSDIEEKILATVHSLLPPSFLAPKTAAPAKSTPPVAPSPLIPGNPRCTLPTSLYAVAGVESAFFLTNTILSQKPEEIQFEVECPIGKLENNRWTLSGDAARAGQYPFNVRLITPAGRSITLHSSTLNISPEDAGSSQNECALLVVGDSLTAANVYPNEIARLFSLPGNPKLQMLGTQTRRPPSSPYQNVAYEGFGGWTWKSFLTRYDLAEPEPGKTNKSPFVFPKGNPPTYKPDLERYFHERCGGRKPDYITILLGINDCFGLKADQPIAKDQGITGMLFQAETLIAEFQKTAPKAKIGICLVPPPNDREGAFVANYKDSYPRWNWKQVQHRLVERQLKHFSARTAENIEIIPVELSIDTWHGYPETNAVHPNETGYRQIGASIYAWIKYHLAQRDIPKPAR